MDSRPPTRRASAFFALAVLIALTGCTPRLGIAITNAPSIEDCIPGSATRPCR